MIYEKCIKEGPYTKADVAKVFGRVPSAASKWFPKEAGFQEGDKGRPSGGARDLGKLRLLIEEILQ